MAHNAHFVPYSTCKAWACRRQFRSYKDYMKYACTYVMPSGFPTNPRTAYPDDYESDPEFLGYRPPRILPYEQARRIVHKLKIQRKLDYVNYIKEHEQHKPHSRLPRAPDRAYPNDFVSWPNYLGNNNIATKNKRFLPYNQAMAYVHKLKIKRVEDWMVYAKSDKRPTFIPFSPWNVYSEFENIKKWLGTDVVQLIKTRVEGHSVLCILHDPADLPNVFSYKIFESGFADAYLECGLSFKFIRIYSFHTDNLQPFREIVARNSSSFEDRTFVAINFFQIQADLDNMLDRVNTIIPSNTELSTRHF